MGTDAAISVKNRGSGGREYWIDSGSGAAGIGSGNFAVYDATAGATRFVIGPTGEVGIGTLSPGSPLEVDSSSNFSIYASNSQANSGAIGGLTTSTTGDGWGVLGETESTSVNAYGVYGLAVNTGSTAEAIGVYGVSYGGSGVGTYGQQGPTQSSTGQKWVGAPVGMWGDAGTIPSATAILGTGDDAAAGYFENNSSQGLLTLWAVQDNAAAGMFYAFNAANNKQCLIDGNADLSCTGTIGLVVPADGGARQVALSAIQSPKNWFEDAGSGQLVKGVAVITLDSDFIQTVNTDMDYKVFPVPNGDCKGLYITHKTATSFEVRELGGGTSSVAFDYRIMALRRNYENVRFADHTSELQKQRETAERMHARKGRGQSHDPQRTPLLKPSSQQAELGSAAVR